MRTGKIAALKRKQNVKTEGRVSQNRGNYEKDTSNNVTNGNLESMDKSKTKHSKQKRDTSKRRLNKQHDAVQENQQERREEIGNDLVEVDNQYRKSSIQTQ